MMKKVYLTLFAFVMAFAPVHAQQLNVGVSRRQFNNHTVADAVLMAPEVAHVILYGQATFTQVKRPELYGAAEIPLINKAHGYLGFDNGFGWVATGKTYAPGAYFTGLTTWVPLLGSYGTYGMYSYVPSVKASTLQVGLFKQIF